MLFTPSPYEQYEYIARFNVTTWLFWFRRVRLGFFSAMLGIPFLPFSEFQRTQAKADDVARMQGLEFLQR